MLFQIIFYFTDQIILTLRHFQRTEQPGRRLHLFPLFFKIIIQGGANAFSLGIRKQFRESFRAYKTPEKRNHQRFLYCVFFDMVFHAVFSFTHGATIPLHRVSMNSSSKVIARQLAYSNHIVFQIS